MHVVPLIGVSKRLASILISAYAKSFATDIIVASLEAVKIVY